MAEEIASYSATWNVADHSGFIQRNLQKGGIRTFGETLLTNPAEFQVIVDLLRNEKPVFLDERTQSIRTGTEEPVGEAEA